MNNSDESTSAADPARVAYLPIVGVTSTELNTVVVTGMTIRYIYVASAAIIPSIILNKKNKCFFTGNSPRIEKI